jgi:hypothetical protein
MKPSSAKAKGRKLQQSIRDLILETFSDLEADDVRSTSMGASGEDLLLSPAARKKFPFSVEAKCQESLNIWSALEQAESNSKEGIHPLVVFKRNRTKTYAILELNVLMTLLAKLS